MKEKVDYTLALSEVDRLPDWRKMEDVHTHGTVLAQRQVNGTSVTLVALGHFFVERWAKNGVEVIGQFYHAAHPMQIFDPYLPGLDLNAVLNR